jgi:hypothetical protein
MNDYHTYYYNPNTNKAVVAHMGTSGLTDWFNNFIYGLGGKKLYKHTSRYKNLPVSDLQNKHAQFVAVFRIPSVSRYVADTFIMHSTVL